MAPALSDKLSRAVWPKLLLLVIVTIIAYLPAIQGGFIWDDDDYVTANPTWRTKEGLA